jgi:hypothetical protein
VGPVTEAMATPALPGFLAAGLTPGRVVARSNAFPYHRPFVPTRRHTIRRLFRAALTLSTTLAAAALIACIEPANAPLDLLVADAAPLRPDVAPSPSPPDAALSAPASGGSPSPVAVSPPDASGPLDAPVDLPKDQAAPKPRDRRVVLIHGMGMETEPATAGMLAVLRALATSDGIVVEPLIDALTTAPSLRDRAVIIVSPSAGALNGNLDPGLGDLPVPLIISIPFFGSQLGLSAGSDKLDRALTVGNPAHPLAAGLTGTVNVYSAPAALHCGSLTGADAIFITWVSDMQTEPCIYAYEAGGQMRRGLAPARRVSFFWAQGTDATAEGRALFRAAVRWGLAAP